MLSHTGLYRRYALQFLELEDATTTAFKSYDVYLHHGWLRPFVSLARIPCIAQMRAIATDGVAWVCLLPVCALGTSVSPAKTEKPIEMLFRRRTRVCVLRDVLDRGVHWRQPANTADLSARRRRCGLSLPLL